MGTATDQLNRGLAKWEIVDKLTDIILRHCKGCIVEIGMGLSTLVLARWARKAERILYSCDVLPKKAKRQFPGHVVALKKSLDFIGEFQEQRVAVVFIDGRHDAETVRKEVRFFLPMIVPGGVMFIHDTLPPGEKYLSPRKCGDVYKVRQELERNPEVDCFTWPYSADGVGLTMVMRKPKEHDYSNDD